MTFNQAESGVPRSCLEIRGKESTEDLGMLAEVTEYEFEI